MRMSKPRAYRAVLIWFLLCLFVFALAAYQIHVNIHFAAAMNSMQAQINNEEALARQIQSHAIVPQFHGPDRALTITELQNLLNNGQPFEKTRDTFDREALLYTDPAGTQVVLTINGDRFTGAQRRHEWGPGANDSVWRQFGVINGIRRAVYILGYLICAFLILAYFTDRDRSTEPQRWGDLRRILAVALLATLLAYVGSRSWRNWNNYFQGPDLAGWGNIAIVFTLLLMLRERWLSRPADDHPRCTTCRYDLTGNTSGVCPECGTPILLLKPQS